MDVLDAKVKAALPSLDVHAYRLVNHGRDNGRFEAWGRAKGSPRGQMLVQLDEVTGAVTLQSPTHAAAELRRWIVGLHFAQFGGLPVRLLFLLLTLASCATIISGNWIWTTRRGSSPRRKLSRLTVGVGAGAWVAFGVLLVASRALPLSWSGRTVAEEVLFFAALAGCMGWAAVVREERTLWSLQLGLAAALWAVVPVLSALRGASLVGVDGVVFFVGAGLGALAWALRPKSHPVAAVQVQHA